MPRSIHSFLPYIHVITTPLTATTKDGCTATAQPMPTAAARSGLILINGLQQALSGGSADDFGILAGEPDSQGLHRIDPPSLQYVHPAWSSDGTPIVLARFGRDIAWRLRSSSIETARDGLSLWTIESDGSGPWELNHGELIAGVIPVCSPHGDRATFISCEDFAYMKGPVANADLCLAAVDGSEQRMLVTNNDVELSLDPFDAIGNPAVEATSHRSEIRTITLLLAPEHVVWIEDPAGRVRYGEDINIEGVGNDTTGWLWRPALEYSEFMSVATVRVDRNIVAVSASGLDPQRLAGAVRTLLEPEADTNGFREVM
jgi:hypothetical protein